MRRLAPLLVALLPGHALADGMPIDANGRFEGGPAIVLTLTQCQKQGLAQGPDLRLTAEQRVAISRIHGFSPSRLSMYDTRKGENACTCHAFNRGLQFSESEFEVPGVYLVTDSRMRAMEAELESD